MRDEFRVHMLNEEGIAKAKQLGEIFSEALDKVDALLSPGALLSPSRARSIVVTKLQEASYWAKRGIAIDPNNCLGE